MVRRLVGTILGVLCLTVVSTPVGAQEITFGGELRPRFELRDLVGVDAVRSEFTSMRTRASMAVMLDPGIRAFVQFQDVRVFGEETSTLGDYSADGLDLHQGWVEFGTDAEEEFSIRVGRQEAAYGGERLVGAVNWAQQGRSFDGARVRYRPSSTAVVDALAFRLRDSQPTPGTPPDESLYGVYSTIEAAGALDLFALVDTHKEALLDGTRYTLGGRWLSNQDQLSWRLEAAYQGGGADSPLLGTQDYRAYMLGGRLSTMLSDELTATLWYDYLSGDNDPGDTTTRAFNTLFATNHKFYGYMDFFTNIPGDTNQRGLQDLALKASYVLGEGRTLRADLHSFRVTASDGLASAHIGEELDLTYGWTYLPGVTFTGGLSYFMAGSDMPPVNAPGDDQVFGYVMADVRF